MLRADAALAGQRAAVRAAGAGWRGVKVQPMPPQSPAATCVGCRATAARAAALWARRQPMSSARPAPSPVLRRVRRHCPTIFLTMRCCRAAAHAPRRYPPHAAYRAGLSAAARARAGARSVARRRKCRPLPRRRHLTPAATLACPLVSALDRWVSEGVQPAAMRWFGSQVIEIKQISSYSCRGMVGSGSSAFPSTRSAMRSTSRPSRSPTAAGSRCRKDGTARRKSRASCTTCSSPPARISPRCWRPATTSAHYNHIHVDLMRRASGDRPCRPEAMSGEVAAAKARAVYAGRMAARLYSGSVPGRQEGEPRAGRCPARTATCLDLDDVTGSCPRCRAAPLQRSIPDASRSSSVRAKGMGDRLSAH